MSDSFYSFSEPFNSGIDFYKADAADVTIDITVSSSLAAEVKKISLANTAINSNLNLTSNLSKIAYASANLAVDGATVVVATERQDGSVVITAEVFVATNITKIAFANASLSIESNAASSATKLSAASCSLSSESNLTSVAKKIAKALSQIAPNSTMTVGVKRIATALVSLTGQINLSIAGKITLATIRINILNNANISVKSIKFAIDGIMDLSAIQSYMLIDDKPITSHNRKFDSSLEPIFVQNKNWNNRKTRYYKSTSRSGRRVFNLSWSWLPGSQDHTVDGNRARDFISSIASDPSHHTFKIIDLDETGITPPTETSYNVLVKDYSETLVRRDLDNGVYWWDCSISMEEV
jgi:hypothetical protein